VIGRGLSRQQRWIVAKAAAAKNHVYFTEILEGLFGWKPHGSVPDRARDVLQSYGYLFSIREIGKNRYGRVMATMSRACRRLEERGLIERVMGHGAIRITPQGREYLLVNEGPPGTFINRKPIG
jgi:hypothetical protein